MKKTLVLAAIAGLSLGLAACDVDQTQEGEAPELQVEGGQMPEYDVDTADVDVEAGTETKTVEVPTLDVDVKAPDAEGTPATAPSE